MRSLAAGSVKWFKPAIQVVVLGIVILAICRTIAESREQFAHSGFRPGEFHFEWLAGAGGLYLLGMLPSAVFWHRILLALRQRPNWLQTLCAFYVGHLGKYVPGKALVVVIRVALIRGPGVQTTLAAASVFVETLTMMAVGAAVAAVTLGFAFRAERWPVALAVLLACVAGIPTIPPLFRAIVALLRVHRMEAGVEPALAGLSGRLMLFGWVTVSCGWVLMGMSLWAVIRAIPDVAANSPGGSLAHDLPLLTACVALALVAGFLSLLPGGAGIRELVVMTLLGPSYGSVVAIVSAVTLRLVWLAAELLMAAACYLLLCVISRGEAENRGTAE